MNENNPFPGAPDTFKNDAYQHPMARTMNGGTSGPEAEESEAAFNRRETGQQIQTELGAKAMALDAASSGSVKIIGALPAEQLISWQTQSEVAAVQPQVAVAAEQSDSTLTKV